jgi:hypothetical protein
MLGGKGSPRELLGRRFISHWAINPDRIEGGSDELQALWDMMKRGS